MQTRNPPPIFFFWHLVFFLCPNVKCKDRPTHEAATSKWCVLDLAGFRIDGMYNAPAACSRPPEYHNTPKFLSSFGKISCGGAMGSRYIKSEIAVDRLCSSTLAPSCCVNYRAVWFAEMQRALQQGRLRLLRRAVGQGMLVRKSSDPLL